MPQEKPCPGRGPARDPVVGAATAVRRAIGRLVDLLGDDEPATMQAAARALAALGARAVVGPLGAGVGRARRVPHRAAIVLMLSAFAGEERAEVVKALQAALEGEDEPGVHMLIRRLLFEVMSAGLFPPRPPRSPGAPGAAAGIVPGGLRAGGSSGGEPSRDVPARPVTGHAPDDPTHDLEPDRGG